MTTDLIKSIEQQHMKSKLPKLDPGDTVRVKIRIKEGNKERLQAYEGVILKIRGEGINKTITVRRVFQGVGVERVFLLHSPKVDSIKIIRKGQIRRAKLYYLRERSGKAARIREKIMSPAALSEEQTLFEEPKAEEPKAEEPKAEEPKAEEPKAEEPKAEEPKAEEPKAEEPKAEEPKAEEPKAEEEAPKED